MKKIALLIGMSEYDDSSLSNISTAVKDVTALKRVLTNESIGGFSEEEVIVLTNPNRMDMETSIYDLFDGRDSEDLLLFFFSGHGVTDDRGRLYLATRETRKNSKGEINPVTAVAASLMQELVGKSRSKRQVIILDSCYSGAFARGMSFKNSSKVDIEGQLGGRGRVVLTSSNSTEYSLYQSGNELSVYTHFLLEGLLTGAADTDANGYISIVEIHEYIRRRVLDSAYEMSPQIYISEEGYSINIARSNQGIRVDNYAVKFTSFKEDFLALVNEKLKTRIRSRFGLLTSAMSSSLGDKLAQVVLEDNFKKWRDKSYGYVRIINLEKKIDESASLWLKGAEAEECIRESIRVWVNKILKEFSEDVSIIAKRHDVDIESLELSTSYSSISGKEFSGINVGDLTAISGVAGLSSIVISLLAYGVISVLLAPATGPGLLAAAYMLGSAVVGTGATLFTSMATTKSLEAQIKKRDLPLWLRKKVVSDSSISNFSTSFKRQFSEKMSESMNNDITLKSSVLEQVEMDIKQALNQLVEKVLISQIE